MIEPAILPEKVRTFTSLLISKLNSVIPICEVYRMAEEKAEKSSSMEEKDKCNEKERKKKIDPELLSCVLQPPISSSYPQYIGIRRLLLHRKAELGRLSRTVSFRFLQIQLLYVRLKFILFGYSYCV